MASHAAFALKWKAYRDPPELATLANLARDKLVTEAQRDKAPETYGDWCSMLTDVQDKLQPRLGPMSLTLMLRNKDLPVARRCSQADMRRAVDMHDDSDELQLIWAKLYEFVFGQEGQVQQGADSGEEEDPHVPGKLQGAEAGLSGATSQHEHQQPDVHQAVRTAQVAALDDSARDAKKPCIANEEAPATKAVDVKVWTDWF